MQWIAAVDYNTAIIVWNIQGRIIFHLIHYCNFTIHNHSLFLSLSVQFSLYMYIHSPWIWNTNGYFGIYATILIDYFFSVPTAELNEKCNFMRVCVMLPTRYYELYGYFHPTANKAFYRASTIKCLTASHTALLYCCKHTLWSICWFLVVLCTTSFTILSCNN